MVFRIILTLVEILVFLWSLKSGFWINLMQNVPYIDFVADTLAGVMGFSSSGISFPSQPFSEEIIKVLIFTCAYPLLEILVKSLCQVVIGKHDQHANIKAAVDRMILTFLSSILTAIVTALFMEYVYLALANWAASFIPWLKYLVTFLSLSVVLVIAFFLFGEGVLVFFLWILTKFIIPTTFKILSVESLVVIFYLFLNVPGVTDSVGEIVILCFGIACLLGGFCGLSVYDHKVDDYWGTGKHRKRTFLNP